MKGIDLKVHINFDDILDDVNDLFLKQVPFAAKLTVNKLVRDVALYERKTMSSFIQGGGVGFTRRGVLYDKAKDKRNPHGRVYIPDEQWKYMQWVVDGGNKQWSRSKQGISLPTKEQKLNKYGNIPSKKRKDRLWREILNRGGDKRAATPLKGGLTKKQFVGTINGIKGVWLRVGGKRNPQLKLLIKFTDKPVKYKRTWPFVKSTTRYFTTRFPRNFNRILRDVVNREQSRLKMK